MNAAKSKLGYLVGAALLLTTLACNVSKLVPPVAQSIAPEKATVTPANQAPAAPTPVSPGGVSAVTPVPVSDAPAAPTAVSSSGDGVAQVVKPGQETTASTFDPGGALAGADSYALVIDSPQGKVTFKIVKSKNEYAIISEGQGAGSEMYIKNDTLYTVAGGNCIGAGLKPGDADSLAHMGDFTAFTTGLTNETLVGEEEVNGVKTNHYQVAGSGGSFDIWAAQDGGYMVRLTGQGPAGQVTIDVTDVNAVGEVTLPAACANAITVPNFQ